MDIHCKLQARKRQHMAAPNFLLYKVIFTVITSVQNLEPHQLKWGQRAEAEIDGILQILNDKLNRYKINKQLYFLLKSRQVGWECWVLSNEGQEEQGNAVGCGWAGTQQWGVHTELALDAFFFAGITQVTNKNYWAEPWNPNLWNSGYKSIERRRGRHTRSGWGDLVCSAGGDSSWSNFFRRGR